MGLSPFSFPAELPLPPLDFSGKRVVVVVEWCEGESFIMVPPEEEECRSVDWKSWGKISWYATKRQKQNFHLQQALQHNFGDPYQV